MIMIEIIKCIDKLVKFLGVGSYKLNWSSHLTFAKPSLSGSQNKTFVPQNVLLTCKLSNE